MSWDQVQGSWKQIRGRIRERLGELTDDELDIVDGRREQFIGLLQERYGMAKHGAESSADDLARTVSSWTPGCGPAPRPRR